MTLSPFILINKYFGPHASLVTSIYDLPSDYQLGLPAGNRKTERYDVPSKTTATTMVSCLQVNMGHDKLSIGQHFVPSLEPEATRDMTNQGTSESTNYYNKRLIISPFITIIASPRRENTILLTIRSYHFITGQIGQIQSISSNELSQ